MTELDALQMHRNRLEQRAKARAREWQKRNYSKQSYDGAESEPSYVNR